MKLNFSLILFILIPLHVRASETLDQRTLNERKTVTKVIFESLNYVPPEDHVNLLLSYLAANGASSDSIKIINTDLLKTKPIPIDIKISDAGEILIGGKSTGTKIVSYSPFNISHRGRTWFYDTNSSIDQNYFALVRFLSPPKKSASLFFPQAWAEDDLNSYFDGAMSQKYQAALITADSQRAISRVAFSTGITLGALHIAAVGQEENARAVIKNILGGDFQIRCDADNGFIITDGDHRSQAGIVMTAPTPGTFFLGVTMKPPRPGQPWFYDGKGRLLPQAGVKAIPDDYKAALAQLIQCKPDQLQALKENMKASLKSVSIATGAPAPPSQPTASAHALVP